jgi:hypothetical protein
VAEIEFLRIMKRGKAARSASAYLYSLAAKFPMRGFVRRNGSPRI